LRAIDAWTERHYPQGVKLLVAWFVFLMMVGAVLTVVLYRDELVGFFPSAHAFVSQYGLLLIGVVLALVVGKFVSLPPYLR